MFTGGCVPTISSCQKLLRPRCWLWISMRRSNHGTVSTRQTTIAWFVSKAHGRTSQAPFLRPSFLIAHVGFCSAWLPMLQYVRQISNCWMNILSSNRDTRASDKRARSEEYYVDAKKDDTSYALRNRFHSKGEGNKIRSSVGNLE